MVNNYIRLVPDSWKEQATSTGQNLYGYGTGETDSPPQRKTKRDHSDCCCLVDDGSAGSGSGGGGGGDCGSHFSLLEFTSDPKPHAAPAKAPKVAVRRVVNLPNRAVYPMAKVTNEPETTPSAMRNGDSDRSLAAFFDHQGYVRSSWEE